MKKQTQKPAAASLKARRSPQSRASAKLPTKPPVRRRPAPRPATPQHANSHAGVSPASADADGRTETRTAATPPASVFCSMPVLPPGANWCCLSRQTLAALKEIEKIPMFPTRKVSARDLPGYLVNLLLQEACLAVVEGDPDRLLHCGIRLKLGRVTQVHVDTDRAFNTAQRGGIEIREVSDAEEAAFIAARNAGKDSES